MDSFMELMKYGPRRILVTGHFGSGKTEFAVSLAFELSRFLKDCGASRPMREKRLALADLDIENPYFRSRERQDELGAAGVTVYSDPFGGRNGSELQTISAAVLAPLQDGDCRIIIDCGGDKSGAMILNQFSRHFRDQYQLLHVVNCNRPGTDSVEKAVQQIRETEYVTGLKVTGLISNAHLIQYTAAETVTGGWEFTKQVSSASGVPALCACAMDRVADEIGKLRAKEGAVPADMEVFRIGMYMRASYLDRKV